MYLWSEDFEIFSQFVAWGLFQYFNIIRTINWSMRLRLEFTLCNVHLWNLRLERVCIWHKISYLWCCTSQIIKTDSQSSASSYVYLYSTTRTELHNNLPDTAYIHVYFVLMNLLQHENLALFVLGFEYGTHFLKPSDIERCK